MFQPKRYDRVTLAIGLLLTAMTISGCGTATTDGVVSDTPTVPMESVPTAEETTPSPEP